MMFLLLLFIPVISFAQDAGDEDLRSLQAVQLKIKKTINNPVDQADYLALRADYGVLLAVKHTMAVLKDGLAQCKTLEYEKADEINALYVQLQKQVKPILKDLNSSVDKQIYSFSKQLRILMEQEVKLMDQAAKNRISSDVSNSLDDVKDCKNLYKTLRRYAEDLPTQIQGALNVPSL